MTATIGARPMSLKSIGMRVLRRPASQSADHVTCDVCVIGSGSAGVSAALEAARLGNKVVVVEASPVLGGQAVNSIVGTFCGLYSNGPRPHRQVYGSASEMLLDLQAGNALRAQRGRNTIIHLYDEIALSRWVERNIAAAGIVPLLGATVRDVGRSGRRIGPITATTRYGDVTIHATHYIDASGDAVLSWLGGLEVQESVTPIRGTQMITLENVDTQSMAKTPRSEINGKLAANAEAYGLFRRDGFSFSSPVPGVALVNMTHVNTPLDALEMSAAALDGRAQADRVFAFLQTEFASIFGRARVRSYGLTGIRQTRTIKGWSTLTADQVRRGEKFDDAIARCSWPIELHDSDQESHWEEFTDDHVHYVPLRSLLPHEVDNVVTVGRCIDADPVALSSVRIIGACIAMGAAAAHACDLADELPVHAIDVPMLQQRLRDNLEREDPAFQA